MTRHNFRAKTMFDVHGPFRRLWFRAVIVCCVFCHTGMPSRKGWIDSDVVAYHIEQFRK